MTFDEWWDSDESRNGIYPSMFARQAWDQQQKVINDLTVELRRMTLWIANIEEAADIIADKGFDAFAHRVRMLVSETKKQIDYGINEQ